MEGSRRRARVGRPEWLRRIPPRAARLKSPAKISPNVLNSNLTYLRPDASNGGSSMALLAELYQDPHAGEQRGAARRSLRLEVEGSTVVGQSRAIIRNLSETGLLLESETALAVGEELLVELPQAGAVPARVVWARRPFFGCEFVRP